MTTQFAKPESALKRADEFISIGNVNEALQVLHTAINSKKSRVWQPILETIMLKYITLCVTTLNGRMAKDGLHQYRVICQTYNINSLETVVKHLLEESEKKAKEAQEKSEKVLLDIEDLEEESESLILSAVSGEDTKDRKDREIVTPWLKLLWETYRTILEILRNNNKLEHLYQDTAQRAFHFCLKFKRKTEFRKVSEMLRNHLQNLSSGKNMGQQHAINLGLPESFQIHLDIRLAQLSAAIDLDLWQEAFRTIQDIHDLISNSKKPPKPLILATYFQRLSQIFWVSESYLYHAYSFISFFNISRNYNKALSEEEIKTMGSQSLLSALCVPLESPIDEEFDFEDVKEKITRMESLLYFGPVPFKPKRKTLVDEMGLGNLPLLPELENFHSLVEGKFNPLKFCSSLKPKLDFIQNHAPLSQYLEPLKRIIVVRFLQQLGKIYETLKIGEFSKLLNFATFQEVESIILEAARNKLINLRIDYQNEILNFKIQSLDSALIREHFIGFSRNLQKAVKLIQPTRQADVVFKQKKQEIFTRIMNNLQEEHQKILQRKTIIEKYKEEIETQMSLKVQEEEAVLKEKKLQQEQEEKEKLEKEREERELIRKQQEEKERKKKEAQEWAEKNAPHIDPEILEKEDVDIDELHRQKMAKEEEEQRQRIKKLNKLSKRLDYVERVIREEEKPLLSQKCENKKKEDEEYFNQQRELFLKEQKENYVRDLEEKKRLSRMLGDKKAFEEKILKQRQEEYEKAKKEREERLIKKKAEIKDQMKQKLIEEARLREEREIQRKKHEEEKKKRFEEEQKKKEQMEMQRKREEEVMQKHREEEEKLKKESTILSPKKESDDWRASRTKDTSPGRREDRYVPPSLRGPDRKERSPPRDRDDRGPPSRDFDRWGPPRDRDDRGPPRGVRDFDRRERSPPRDRDDRGPPSREFDRWGPPRDRSDRGPPRGIRDFDRRERSPPRDRDDRGPPSRDFDRWGPPRDRSDRGPPRGVRDFDRRERSPPRDRDDRGPPSRDFDRRGPPRDRDDRGPPRGVRDFDRRERSPPRDRDDRIEKKEPLPEKNLNNNNENQDEDDGFTVVKRPGRR